MMQPINLLPPYIYDKQKKFAMVGLWAAVIAVIVLGAVFFMVNLNQKLEAAKAERDKAQEYSNQWNEYQKKITDVQASVKTIKDQMDFVSSAKKYNDAWPAAFETLREYSSSEILLTSASFQGGRKVMTVTGFAENDRKIVKWWQQLVNHAEYDAVDIGLPSYGYTPGGGSATNGGFAGAGGFGGRRSPGMGGMPPGMSSGMPGMPGGAMASGISRTSAPGMSGGMSSGPPGGMGAMTGAFGGGGRGGFSSFGGGGAAGGGSGTETEIEGRRGITFTATLVLKKPLADGIETPVWPPGTAAAAGGGGFGGARMGGMPGMPGGMSGMPPGMSGMPPGMSGPPPGMTGPTGGKGKE